MIPSYPWTKSRIRSRISAPSRDSGGRILGTSWARFAPPSHGSRAVPAAYARFSAASTRAGVSGNSSMRTPVASKNALAIAAAAAAMTSSPAPSRAFGQALHHDRRDLRAFVEAQHRVLIPIQAGDVGGVERHFFVEHAAGGLHQLAADLRLDVARIHHLAGVDGSVQVLGDRPCRSPC